MGSFSVIYSDAKGRTATFQARTADVAVRRARALLGAGYRVTVWDKTGAKVELEREGAA